MLSAFIGIFTGQNAAGEIITCLEDENRYGMSFSVVVGGLGMETVAI